MDAKGNPRSIDTGIACDDNAADRLAADPRQGQFQIYQVWKKMHTSMRICPDYRCLSWGLPPNTLPGGIKTVQGHHSLQSWLRDVPVQQTLFGFITLAYVGERWEG